VRLSNIIPPLLNILQNADFKTKKEACWAISNATSGGLQEPNQIRYLVTQGCIKPMCDLLNSMDNKIIQVALDGLENILKVGEIDKEAGGPGAVNQYAQFIEEAGGMVSIHNLQHHENLEIYKKCFYIMDSESTFRLLHIILTVKPRILPRRGRGGSGWCCTGSRCFGPVCLPI
jgi:importin subunit alpha-1